MIGTQLMTTFPSSRELVVPVHDNGNEQRVEDREGRCFNMGGHAAEIRGDYQNGKHELPDPLAHGGQGFFNIKGMPFELAPHGTTIPP